MGMTVKNQKGEKLGKIKDVVLNLDAGEVSYVVLAKSGATKGTGRYLALPLTAFNPSADQKHLILNAEKEQVRSASGFASKNWPSLDSTAVGAPSSLEEIIIIDRPARDQENKDNKQKDKDEKEK